MADLGLRFLALVASVWMAGGRPNHIVGGSQIPVSLSLMVKAFPLSSSSMELSKHLETSNY